MISRGLFFLSFSFTVEDTILGNHFLPFRVPFRDQDDVLVLNDVFEAITRLIKEMGKESIINWVLLGQSDHSDQTKTSLTIVLWSLMFKNAFGFKIT